MAINETEQTPNLSGILQQFPKTRFWGYVVFALINLFILIIASLVMFGRIDPAVEADFTDWMAWISYSLNLIGTAFGFTAATNVTLKSRK